MSAKHTPGPWEAVFGSADGIQIAAGSSPVALVYAEIEQRGAHTANAQLIAEAPALLGQHEADLADLHLLRLAIQAGDPKAELLIRVQDMERRKRAAIAKATGSAA